MAKKRKSKVNKSESIRQILAGNPNAPSAEVIAALKEQKIDVTAKDVGTIRWKMGKSGASPSTTEAAEAAPRRKVGGKRKKMARGDKTKAVRDLLLAKPELGPTAAAEELQKRGWQVTATYVSNVKHLMKNKTQDAAAESRAASVPVSARASREADSVSVNALFAAKDLVQKLGGLEQARQALATLAQLSQLGRT